MHITNIFTSNASILDQRSECSYLCLNNGAWSSSFPNLPMFCNAVKEILLQNKSQTKPKNGMNAPTKIKLSWISLIFVSTSDPKSFKVH